MSPVTNKYYVSLLAGCVNAPVGVKRADSYYTLLQNRLPELDITLGRYYSYTDLLPIAKKMLDKRPPQMMVFFVRLFPYMVLNKPLVKLVDEHEKHYYRIHPGLKDRKTKQWPAEWDRYVEQFDARQFPVRNYFAARDLNIMAGCFLGLHRWAMGYSLSLIDELHDECERRGVKLIIVGPPQNPETFMGNWISKYLEKELSEKIRARSLEYLSIHIRRNKKNEDIFQADKIHFNLAGHAFLSELLEQGLQPYYAMKRSGAVEDIIVES
jgi:hypothetical protein